MNWKVGDMAIIVGCNHQQKFIGLECTVIALQSSFFQGCFLVDVPGHTPIMYDYYSIRPEHLKRLSPPNELSTWDDCVFKPEVLVT